jgi:two-component system, NarL family, nitrate/nitrite response regulator NarL
VQGIIRVVVADDHPLFREGVIASLAADAEVLVVGQAADAEGAFRLACDHQPDVVLLDVSMPGDGLRAASRIVSACPTTRVVMLTVSEDEDDLMTAMKAGASGYVLKGVSARELSRVIHAVHAGQRYVPPGLAFGVLRELSQPQAADPLAGLSPREREVLGLVAGGLNNAEIAQQLGLAEKSIKHHMSSILKKLQVRGRVEAALLALKNGLGPGDKA